MRQNGLHRVETYRNQESAFSTGIRPLFAILALLLCAIAARADKPIVIKDSEAIHYVGKEVEVRGRVAFVKTSPLGTAFYQFRRRIPQSKVRRIYWGWVKS
jgi:hypothetical protein